MELSTSFSILLQRSTSLYRCSYLLAIISILPRRYCLSFQHQKYRLYRSEQVLSLNLAEEMLSFMLIFYGSAFQSPAFNSRSQSKDFIFDLTLSGWAGQLTSRIALVQLSMSRSCFFPFLLGVSILLISLCLDSLTADIFLPSLLRVLVSLLRLALLSLTSAPNSSFTFFLLSSSRLLESKREYFMRSAECRAVFHRSTRESIKRIQIISQPQYTKISSVIHHQRELQLIHECLGRQDVLAELPDVLPRRVFPELPQSDLHSLHKIHVFFGGTADVKLLKPLHLVHVKYGRHHALRLAQQQVLELGDGLGVVVGVVDQYLDEFHYFLLHFLDYQVVEVVGDAGVGVAVPKVRVLELFLFFVGTVRFLAKGELLCVSVVVVFVGAVHFEESVAETVTISKIVAAVAQSFGVVIFEKNPEEMIGIDLITLHFVDNQMLILVKKI